MYFIHKYIYIRLSRKIFSKHVSMYLCVYIWSNGIIWCTLAQKYTYTISVSLTELYVWVSKYIQSQCVDEMLVLRSLDVYRTRNHFKKTFSAYAAWMRANSFVSSFIHCLLIILYLSQQTQTLFLNLARYPLYFQQIFAVFDLLL